MIKFLKKIDRTIVQTFDYLGIPRFDHMDKSLLKLGKKIKNYRIQDTRGIEVTVILGFALVATTLGSVTSLYVLDVPEAVKDGLRLTSLLCSVGLAGLGLHILVKKLSGAK